MRDVVVVAFDRLQGLDLVGPVEVFAAADDAANGKQYRCTVVASGSGQVQTSSGLRIATDRTLGQVRGPIDTLVVVGGEGTREALGDRALIDGVARLGARARRVTSVCSGAFLLAEAGLLDGRRATTHWSVTTTLARAYPSVRVDPDPIVVRDGNVWTSAGVTAGMDLALALVEDDLGREVALAVARRLVLFLRRPANQSQFSAQLAAQVASRDPLRELQGYIVEHPEADLSVEALARRAGMSARHLARCFTEEVGVTPARYVLRTRLESARRRLEDTDEAVEHVARRCGFGTTETMRKVFLRHLRTTPSEYRRRFKAA